MKILIFYASYGGGHLNAAKSIDATLKKIDTSLEIELIDCMKYVNITLEKVTTAAYRQMAMKLPWAWGRIYSDSQKGPLAHISSRANKIMAIKLLKLLREKKPDLIISTHPFGSQMCSYLKRKGKIESKIATIMTDFAPHDQWLIGSDYTDYFFVAHDKMKQYLIYKDIPEEKIYATGIPISERFLLSFNRKEVLVNYGLEENKKNILFFAGGEFGLGKSKTLEIFESLITYIDNIQVIAISGKNEKMNTLFKEIVSRHKKEKSIKVLSYTEHVPELMSITDLIITKPGGLTTSESLACNLPMVIINPIPGQEEENAEFLESKGIGIWIKKYDNPKNIFQELFSHPEKLEEMKQNTKQLAQPHSAENICNILLNYQKNGI